MREFKLYVGVFWAKFNIASICGSILGLVNVFDCCCCCWDWLLEGGEFWLDTGVCWACLNIYCICELPDWELFWIGWIGCGVGNYWADFNILVIKGSLANILSDGNIGVVPVWAFDMFGVFITGWGIVWDDCKILWTRESVRRDWGCDCWVCWVVDDWKGWKGEKLKDWKGSEGVRGESGWLLNDWDWLICDGGACVCWAAMSILWIAGSTLVWASPF